MGEPNPFHPASVTFLGTGTSGGVPTIACDCPTCCSTDPRDTRLRTAAVVRWTDDSGHPRVVLIDAGPDLRLQALRHGLQRCDAILITHNHVDHIFGLDEVRRFNAANNMEPIDVHAEPYTWESLRRVYKHIFDRASNFNDSFVASLIQHMIAMPDGCDGQNITSRKQRIHDTAKHTQGGAGRPIDLHDMRFTPIRFLHGRQPILGFRIEPVPGSTLEARCAPTPGSVPGFAFAWCTDVSAVPPMTWDALRGVRTLALDGLRHRHHPTHLTLERACEVAADAGADHTWLIHIAHEVLHARDEPALPAHVRLAVDGLTIWADGSSAVQAAPGEWRACCFEPHPREAGVPVGLPPRAVPASEPPA